MYSYIKIVFWDDFFVQIHKNRIYWGPGIPWVGPSGPLGLLDPWALGTLGPWGPWALGTLGLGDPWALGTLGLGDPGPWGPLGLGDPGPWGPLGPGAQALGTARYAPAPPGMLSRIRNLYNKYKLALPS